MSVWELLKKNALLLFRARSSASIIILGPLVLIFLAGLAFDHANVYNVRVSFFSPEDAPLVDAFRDALTSSQFRVEQATSLASCQDAVKSGDAHACVSFSSNFNVGTPGNEITFFVDYSRVNLVSTIVDVLSSKVGLRTSELSRNLSTSLLDALDVTRRTVREKRGTLVSLATENDAMLKGIVETKALLDGLSVTLSVDAFAALAPNQTGASSAVKWSSFTNDSTARLNAMLVWLVKAKADINDSGLAAGAKENVTWLVESTINQTLIVRHRLTNTSNVSSTEAEELNESLTALKFALVDVKERTDALAVVKENVSEGLEGLRLALDRSLLSVLELQVGINRIDEALQGVRVTDAGTVSQPVRTTVRPVAAERTYLNYLFPILVVLVIALTALLLAPSILLFERRSPAVFRNFMAPVHPLVFVAASFITSVAILMAQVLVILLIAALVFSIPFVSILPTLVPAVLLVVLFVFAGLAIGFIFDDDETANLAGITAAALLLFLSDVVVPLESMPGWLASLARFNPIVIGGSLVRKVLLFDLPLSSLWGALGILLGYIAVAAIVLFVVHRLASGHVVSKLLHRKQTAPLVSKK